MTVENPISLWDRSTEERDYARAFDSTGTVDLAVVGGGYTGLSAALHAAEAGLGVHLLEARQIGFGGSGRNFGLVNASAWLPPARVRETLGPTYGPRFVEDFSRAPAYVFSLIERHQMRCEATRSGTIHAAHGPAGLRDLEARHAEWRRLGEPVELLDRAEVARLVGSEAFHGGLLDRRAGTINPMGYCRGLARAAVAAGARISTDTRATRLRREGGVWRVETDRGTLSARQVVLGTNAYTDDLWPGLSRIYTPIHYFQFATRPLGPEAAHILPGRQGLWDTGRIMLSVRRDASDRLLIGSMGKVLGGLERGLSQRWARRQLGRMFPGLGPVAFEEAWHGRIAMTPDHLPKLYELAEGLFTAIGYNGRGITTGTVLGKALADLAAGRDRGALPLPVTAMQAAPGASLMARLYQAAFTANQAIRGT